MFYLGCERRNTFIGISNRNFILNLTKILIGGAHDLSRDNSIPGATIDLSGNSLEQQLYIAWIQC